MRHRTISAKRLLAMAALLPLSLTFSSATFAKNGSYEIHFSLTKLTVENAATSANSYPRRFGVENPFGSVAGSFFYRENQFSVTMSVVGMVSDDAIQITYRGVSVDPPVWRMTFESESYGDAEIQLTTDSSQIVSHSLDCQALQDSTLLNVIRYSLTQFVPVMEGAVNDNWDETSLSPEIIFVVQHAFRLVQIVPQLAGCESNGADPFWGVCGSYTAWVSCLECCLQDNNNDFWTGAALGGIGAILQRTVAAPLGIAIGGLGMVVGYNNCIHAACEGKYGDPTPTQCVLSTGAPGLCASSCYYGDGDPGTPVEPCPNDLYCCGTTNYDPCSTPYPPTFCCDPEDECCINPSSLCCLHPDLC
jgi:hypothetical protein